VVLWEANGVDAKGLDYARLTAALVEAVKELQAQSLQAQKDLRMEKEHLRRELAELRAAVAQLAAQQRQRQACRG